MATGKNRKQQQQQEQAEAERAQAQEDERDHTEHDEQALEDALVAEAQRREQLKADQKRIRDELRALEGKTPAAPKQPARQSLADVVARQSELPGRWVVLGLAAQTDERVKVGQDAEQALADVLARYAQVVADVLAARAAGATLQDTTWAHLATRYPATSKRTGPGNQPKAK